MGTIAVSMCVVWYRKERDRMVHVPWKELYLKRQKSKRDEESAEMGGLIATQGHGAAWTCTAAATCVWVHGSDVAALSPVASDTAKVLEDRAIQSWPCPSLTTILGRPGPDPHCLKPSGERQHKS